MSICRIPFASANSISRKIACLFSCELAGVAAAIALFLPFAQAQAGASLGASPTAVSFSPPQFMVGFASPLAKVTITNTGNVPLNHLSFKIQGSSPQDFSLALSVCPTLQPQDQCTEYVRFRPSAIGTRSAALWIDSDELKPQPTLQLTGVALPPAPKLATSTDELDFNDQLIGTASAPMTVQLRNDGAQNLDIAGLSVAPEGEFVLSPPSDCSILASPLSGLNPTFCSVSVKFIPNGPGERTAILTIASTDPDGPKQVRLRGETAHPIILVNPPSVHFGSALVGDPTSRIDRIVAVTNMGTADLVISSYKITQGIPNASDFEVLSALPCTVKAGSGQACAVSVRFQPHGSGDRTAKLTLSSTDEEGAITLVGFGEVFLPMPPPVGAATDVLFCSAAAPASGAAPTCSTGAPQSCEGAGQLLLRTIPVTRAFGSNNPGAALPQPTLGAAVASGAMGPAVLEIMSLGLGQRGSHLVTLNGTGLGSINLSGDGQWRLVTIAVPPTAIRFPQVAARGSSPTPITNIVAITPDVGGSGACVSVAWARLRIKAMSPVVFIHGMNSDGTFFTRHGIAGGTTLVGPPGAFVLGPTPGSFLAAGIPTDTSINLPATASVTANATTLSTLIPAIVRSFGASHVHIVAHDKGGLDARAWLSLNAAIDRARVVAPFSVISFTTLSTPHQGTAAADLQAALQATSIEGMPVSALRALGFVVGNPAVLDLTTFAAPALELASPLPGGVDYRSVGGDADLNSNGLIQFRPVPDEYIAERSEQPLLAAMFAVNPPATDVAVTSVYHFMFATRTVVVAPITLPLPVPPFFVVVTIPAPVPGPPSLNDLLVTTPSALGSSPFSPVPALIGTRGVDHASVASPRAGAAIIPLLRASDILRGGLR